MLASSSISISLRRVTRSHSSKYGASRCYRWSTVNQRDVLAKYRRAPPTQAIWTPVEASDLRSISKNEPKMIQNTLRPKDEYKTSSTTPAGTSFQEVPKPDIAQEGIRTAIPLPAMIPIDIDTSSPKKPPRDWRETRDPLNILGVKIPPKPRAPGEEECCMSGCVHCVYTIYAEELESYTTALASAQKVLEESQTPKSEWPVEVKDLVGDSKGGGLEGAREMIKREERKVESGMDSSMSAFLALENRLKKKQAPDSSAAS